MATLINRWKFENNANDSVGSNNGTLTGSYSSSNPKESSYSLDRASYINFASPLDNSIITSATARFSLSFWFYATTLSFSLNEILYRNTGVGGIFIYMIQSQPYSTVIHIRFIENTTSNSNTYEFNMQVSPQTTLASWNNIIITYDYSQPLSDRCLAYMNGVVGYFPFASVTSLSSIYPSTTLKLGNASSEYKIDDFRFYNGVLSPTEITQISNNSVISNISPSIHISSGDVLIITGTNLLKSSISLTVTINGTNYTSLIISSSSTQITMTAPNLPLWIYDLIIISDGIPSNSYSISYVPAPVTHSKWNFEKNTNDSTGPNHGTLTGGYASGGI